MARLILTTPGEDTPAGGNSDVIGTAAPGEVITLFPGVITLDPSFNLGGDVVVFPEARSAYTIVRDGSNVVIRSDDITITIPFGTAGIELRFADETLVLRVANNQLLIGDQIVTNTEAPIGGESGLVATPIDAGTVSEDGAVVNVNLLSTASDSDGDTLSIGTIISATTNTGRVVEVTRTGSTLSINPDQFNNLDDGEAETVTVRYTITDGDGTIQNEVTLRVTGADDIPTSGPLFPADITEDDPPIVINLLSRADDPDGEPVNVGNILTVQTSSGAPLVYTRNGNSITIDPAQFGDDLNEGDTETVTITYTITDGDGLEATNTLTLNIRGVNDGPDAFDDTGTTDENNSLAAGVPGLLGNDVNNTPSATLSVTEVNGAAANIGATITLASGALLTVNADGSYSYNPNGQYEGLDTGESATDTFSYEVSDSNGLSDTGDVTITITGVNDAPVAVADTFTTNEDTLLTGNVLANDTDVDGEPLTALLVSGPAHAGSFTLNANGTFSYTPAANYSGPDSFTYKVADGTVDGNIVTVSLTVTPVNDPPVANDDSRTTNEDMAISAGGVTGVLANDTDADAGTTLTVTAVNGVAANVGSVFQLPSGALLLLNDEGSYNYNPNGSFNRLAAGQSATDTFSYTVSDGSGGTDTATVTITITGLNDVPVANDDSYAVNEDNGLIVPAATGVLANDSDPDSGTTLNAILVSGPAHAASFTLNANGSFSYTPAANYNGPDSFTYKVNDGTVDGNTVTVSLIVNPVNDAPQGTDGFDFIVEDSSRIFTAADFGFSDPVEGNGFAGVVLTTLPNNGQFLLNGAPVTVAGTFVTAAQIAANQLVFVPDANETGSPYAIFTFQVRDTGGTANGGQDTDQSPSFFTVHVTGLNDPPTSTGLNGDVATFIEDGPPVRLDVGGDATLTDVDNSLFVTGTLTVSITANEVGAEDVLGFATTGTVTAGPGSTVLVGGVTIGTFAGGTGGADLVFTFNFEATPAVVQELLRVLTYANSNSGNPSTAARGLTLTLTDGDGGTLVLNSTVNVASRNDAPSGADNIVGLAEDQSFTFLPSSFGQTDPEGDNLAGVVITTLPTNGQLLLNGSPITVAGTFVTQADIAANRLEFVPDANENGSPYATFTFQVRDVGGTANGGQDTDQSPNVFTFLVSPVNDAPTLANLQGDAVTFTEDQAAPVRLDLGSNATVADIDSANFDTGTLSVSVTGNAVPGEDVLGISAGGTVTVGAGIVSVGGVQVATFAGGSGGIALTITFDADATPAAVQAVVRALDYRNSNTVNPSTAPRTVSVTLTDGDGGTTVALAATVNVIAINDAPVTVADAYVVNEDATLTVAGPGVLGNDPDPDLDPRTAELVTGPANASSFTLNADGSFTYVPNANFNGTDTFTYHATDSNNLDGNDVTVTITVNPVNDPPVLANLAGDTVSYTEEQASPALLDSGTAATVTDIDSTNFDTGTLTVAVTAGGTPAEDVLRVTAGGTLTVGAGTLSISGVQVATFTGGSGGTPLVITFDPDATPAAVQTVVRALNYSNSNLVSPSGVARTVSVTLTDGDGGTTGAITTTVNVLSINDAPNGTNGNQTILEDTPYALTAANFAFTDPESNGLASVIITTLATNGVLFYDSDPTAGVTLVAVTAGQEISAADITAGRLTFAPDLNENGTPYATFTFQVRDDGGTANGGVNLDTSAATFTFNVTPVNDQPDAINDTNTTNEDTPVTAATPGVLGNDTDPDVPTTLTVTQVNGVPGNVGVATPVTGGGTVTVASTGGYTYNPNGAFESLGAGASTQVSFTYRASDGTLTDDATVTITINGVNDNPTAVADNYTGATGYPDAIGNVTYTSATSVLANDSDVDVYTPVADTLQVTAGSQTNAGGTITFTADGNFTYTPAAGFGGPGVQAVFTYTVTDDHGGSSTGTVTIDVGAPVWFIDNSAPGSTNVGTQANPFTSIASFNAAQGTANGPAPGETIYLRSGTYSEADGINLTNNQVLIGGGDNLVIGGVTIEAGDTTPIIGATAGDAIDVAQGNTISGIDIGTTSGAGIADSNGTVGTLTVSDVGFVAGRTGQIVDVDQGGTLNVTLNNAVSTGSTGANGGVIDLDQVSGSFIVTGTIQVSGTHSQTAIDITGATSNLAASFGSNIGAGTAVSISSGANTAINFSGNTAGSSLTLQNGIGINTTSGTGLNVTSGTLTVLDSGSFTSAITTQTGQILNLATTSIGTSGVAFDSLTATGNVAGTAISINNVDGTGNTFNGGTVSINSTAAGGNDGIFIGGGSAATFNFGSTTIGATGDDGIDIDAGGNGAVTFSTVLINGSGDAGVEIDNATGTVTISGGSIGNTNDPAGIGVDINGGSANITISATISDATAAGDVVEVSGRTGGMVDFNGLISSTGGGIDLEANTGGTVRFDGGMNINTGAVAAFESTGGSTGATLVITDTNGGTAPNNVLTTTTGVALNVANTTIGAEDVTFQSISSNGASSGIILDTTGSAGGLTVTGDAGITANGSGGTINASSGSGVILNSTQHVVLDQMNIQNGGNDGVRATNVTNLSVSLLNVTNNGDAVTEYGLDGTNVTGNVSFTSTNFVGSFADNVRIQNSSGSTTVNVTGSTFSLSEQGGGFFHVSTGSANSNVTISSSSFTGNFTTGLLSGVSDPGATGSVSFMVTGGTYTNNNAGIQVIGSGGADVLFNISGATINNNPAAGIAIDLSDQSTVSGSMVGTIINNTINMPASGSGNGIFVSARGSGDTTVLIDNNTITNRTQYGIHVHRKEGDSNGSLNATITNNTVTTIDIASDLLFPIDGIRVEAGAASGDAGTLYADVRGNIVTGAGTQSDSPGFDIRYRHRFGITFEVAGAPLGPLTGAQVESFLDGQNPAAGTTSATTTTNFIGVAAGSGPVPLMAGSLRSEPESQVATPTSSELGLLIEAALERWSEAGATDAQLAGMRSVEVNISDLGGLVLGLSIGGHILIDDNAAGYGWFVDATPLDDSEFAGGGAAEDRMDLLTVLMHELAHQIGLDDSNDPADAGMLMYGFLDPGDRHLPGATSDDSAAGSSAKHGTGGDLARPESIASSPGAGGSFHVKGNGTGGELAMADVVGKAARLDDGGFGRADVTKAAVPAVLTGASDGVALPDDFAGARLDVFAHGGVAAHFAIAEFNLA